MNRFLLAIALSCQWMVAEAHLDWIDSIVVRQFDSSIFRNQIIESSSKEPIINIDCKFLKFITENNFLNAANNHLYKTVTSRIDQFMKDVSVRDREFELEEEFCLDNTLSIEAVPIYTSDTLISILESTHSYLANSAHGSTQYHGYNFYQINGSAIELTFDLLSHPEKDLKAYLLKYSENIFKADRIGYFSDGFKTELQVDELDTFIITNDTMVVIFQSYTVDGLIDYPHHIKFNLNQLKPYLKEEWQNAFCTCSNNPSESF